MCGLFLRLFKTQDLQSEKLSEGKVININEQSGCDRKDDDVPEVMPAKNFKRMELSDILQNTDTAKDSVASRSKSRKECDNSPRQRKDACSTLCYMTMRKKQALVLNYTF